MSICCCSGNYVSFFISVCLSFAAVVIISFSISVSLSLSICCCSSIYLSFSITVCLPLSLSLSICFCSGNYLLLSPYFISSHSFSAFLSLLPSAAITAIYLFIYLSSVLSFSACCCCCSEVLISSVSLYINISFSSFTYLISIYR